MLMFTFGAPESRLATLLTHAVVFHLVLVPDSIVAVLNGPGRFEAVPDPEPL